MLLKGDRRRRLLEIDNVSLVWGKTCGDLKRPSEVGMPLGKIPEHFNVSGRSRLATRGGRERLGRIGCGFLRGVRCGLCRINFEVIWRNERRTTLSENFVLVARS
jgi:hypothetical protein